MRIGILIVSIVLALHGGNSVASRKAEPKAALLHCEGGGLIIEALSQSPAFYTVQGVPFLAVWDQTGVFGSAHEFKLNPKEGHILALFSEAGIKTQTPSGLLQIRSPMLSKEHAIAAYADSLGSVTEIRCVRPRE